MFSVFSILSAATGGEACIYPIGGAITTAQKTLIIYQRFGKPAPKQVSGRDSRSQEMQKKTVTENYLDYIKKW